MRTLHVHMCVREGVQRAVNMVTWGLGWESGKVFWMNGEQMMLLKNSGKN